MSAGVIIWYNDTGRGVYGIMIPARVYGIMILAGVYGIMIPAGVYMSAGVYMV